MPVARRIAGADEFERAVVAGASLGIVWTHDEAAPERQLEPGPGERIVDDLVIEGDMGELGTTSRGQTARRITADPQDLGVVYNGSLKRIGRVVRRRAAYG